MGRTILNLLRDLVLLVSRLALGAVLLLHGWNRWGGGQGIDKQAAYLAAHDVPQPLLLAWGATVLELAGGIFLIFGALTPLVAAALVAQQVCIIVWLAWQRGPWLWNKGWEYPLVMAAFSLMFVVFGAGRVAVDNLIRRPRDESTTVDDPDAYPTSRY